MMNLYEWARKWSISYQALNELLGTAIEHVAAAEEGLTESGVQSRIRIEAADKGIYLWRNNVGAGTLDNGLFMRWGLGNDSHQLNAKLKSADLIGIRPVVVQPHHIGHTIGQFVSREVKREGWKWSGNEKEQAQLLWCNLINRNGGDAKITNKVGTL